MRVFLRVQSTDEHEVDSSHAVVDVVDSRCAAVLVDSRWTTVQLDQVRMTCVQKPVIVTQTQCEVWHAATPLETIYHSAVSSAAKSVLSGRSAAVVCIGAPGSGSENTLQGGRHCGPGMVELAAGEVLRGALQKHNDREQDPTSFSLNSLHMHCPHFGAQYLPFGLLSAG